MASDLGYQLILAHPGNYSTAVTDKIWIIRHCTATNYSDNYPHNLGLYWQNNNVSTSTQYGVSDTMVRQYVPHRYTCYATRQPGNGKAVHIEYIGQSWWSRAEWLKHDGMLRRGAKLEVEIARREAVDLSLGRNLTNAEFGAYRSGVATHYQHTQVFAGTHVDPGGGFPHDVVWKYIRELLTPPPTQEDDDMALTDVVSIPDGDFGVGRTKTGEKLPLGTVLGYDYVRTYANHELLKDVRDESVKQTALLTEIRDAVKALQVPPPGP